MHISRHRALHVDCSSHYLRETNPCTSFPCFLENGKENYQENKDFYPYRTPKILGKEGKNAQCNKEFLAEGKNKEPPKKTRKGRTWPFRDHGLRPWSQSQSERCKPYNRAKKSTQTFFVQSFSTTLRVMDVRAKIVDVRTKKCVFLWPPWWGETF